MSEQTSFARSTYEEANQATNDASEIAVSLGEVRRQLASEVKIRRDLIKPLEQALRALKDPHRNAVALYEACAALERPPDELALPKAYSTLIGNLRRLAEAQLSELEFT